MNAIDLLKQDHDYVDMLFGRIEDTPPSRHPAIFKQIKGELDTHAHVEETIFYPEAKKKGDKELKDIVMESLEEHKQIKMFLAQIAKSRSADKREARLKVLIEDTRHHVKEEENEMFPLVEDHFTSDQLEVLGERMEGEKVRFQAANGISQRREEPQGAFTKVVEKAKAVVASVMSGSSKQDESPSSTKKSDGAAKKKVVTAATAKRTGQVRAPKTREAKPSNGKGKSSNGDLKSKSTNAAKPRTSRARKNSGSRSSASR